MPRFHFDKEDGLTLLEPLLPFITAGSHECRNKLRAVRYNILERHRPSVDHAEILPPLTAATRER